MTVVLALVALAAGPPAHATEPPRCRTRACHHRVARRQHRERWGHRPWAHAYHHLDAAMRAKLLRVRGCESTHRPWAVSAGGTYRGYYQYDEATAREAGFTRDPATLTSAEGRAEQHVRTARFARRVGWGRWPLCGRR